MSHHFHWLLSMFQPISHPVTLINSWDRDRMKLHPTKSAASQRRFWQFVDSLEAGASMTSNDNYVRHQKPFLCAWCVFAVTPPKKPNRKRDNSSMESVTWWWQLFCTATSESQQFPPSSRTDAVRCRKESVEWFDNQREDFCHIKGSRLASVRRHWCITKMHYVRFRKWLHIYVAIL